MTANLTPTEWFDQFKIYVDYITPHWPSPHTTWCPRHWAPAPVLMFNGVPACRAMAKAFMSEHPADTSQEYQALFDLLDRPLCCYLGDARVYAIWGACPPASVYGSSMN